MAHHFASPCRGRRTAAAFSRCSDGEPTTCSRERDRDLRSSKTSIETLVGGRSGGTAGLGGSAGGPNLARKKTLQFEALLAPGETLVTDVQEVSPGVFQFTQLTPEPGPEENLVLIKAQRHFVDLEGNVELLSAPSIILQSGSIGAISVFTDNSVYQIQMNVEEEDGATKLTGQVTSQQNAPSQVSDIDGSR